MEDLQEEVLSDLLSESRVWKDGEEVLPGQTWQTSSAKGSRLTSSVISCFDIACTLDRLEEGPFT